MSSEPADDHPPVDHPLVDHPPVDDPPVDHPPVGHSPVDHPPVGHSPVDHPAVDHPPVARPLGDVSTARLHLRRMRGTDVDTLAPVFAKAEVWQFPYGRGFSWDETQTFVDAQTRCWDESGFGLWVASERSGDRVVGYVGLAVPRFLPEILPAVEVGWRFDPDVWGRGYATEGATAALDEAFATLGLDEVCSVPQADNPASVRVAERLGMRLARTVTIPATDRRRELVGALFEITAGEWRALRATAAPRD